MCKRCLGDTFLFPNDLQGVPKCLSGRLSNFAGPNAWWVTEIFLGYRQEGGLGNKLLMLGIPDDRILDKM